MLATHWWGEGVASGAAALRTKNRCLFASLTSKFFFKFLGR
jgi:hypothetical protein